VHNNNFLDVVVYVVPDGRRARLGLVTGKCNATLEIPAGLVARQSGFRLFVDPVGSSETYTTERIYVSPGSVVVLDVGSVLAISSWHLETGER